MPSIRRLGPKDGRVLAGLARDDEDFDLDDRGEALKPLRPAAARAYLADPHVLQSAPPRRRWPQVDEDDVCMDAEARCAGGLGACRQSDCSEVLPGVPLAEGARSAHLHDPCFGSCATRCAAASRVVNLTALMCTVAAL